MILAPRHAAPGLALASLLAVSAGADTGCRRELELLPARDGGMDGGSADARPAGTDAAPGCPGAPLRLGASARCAGEVVAEMARFALCACASVELTMSLTSDSFDSSGAAGPGERGASVGVSGRFTAAAPVTLGGALYVSGAVETRESAEVAQALHAGGGVTVRREAQVGTDAYCAGDVTGPLEVTGTLHLPSAAALDPQASAAKVERAPVSVAAPCDCQRGQGDAAAVIAGLAGANDDLAAGLSPTSLASGAVAPAQLELACGRYFLTAVDLQRDLALKVRGHVVIAVAGDVMLAGALDVALEPDAELDLLVGGRLTSTGGRTVGSRTAPSRVRLWVAGSDAVQLHDAPVLAGVLDAPRATVSASEGLVVYGSVRAAGFTAGGPVNLHYDRAILRAGEACGAAASTPVE